MIKSLNLQRLLQANKCFLGVAENNRVTSVTTSLDLPAIQKDQLINNQRKNQKINIVVGDLWFR